MKYITLLFSIFFLLPLQAEVNTVKDSALVPSQANRLRKAREEAEIQTESAILEKIEAQRLRDEKKRIQELNKTSSDVKVIVKHSPSLVSTARPFSLWYFGERAFLSLGLGSVQYPRVKNINSHKIPAYFLSFGGYASSSLLVDFSLFYS